MHRLLLELFNFFGVLNFKISKNLESLQISNKISIKNLLLVVAVVLTRPAFQTYIYAYGIKQSAYTAQLSNSSKFLKIFVIFGNLIIQLTAYMCVAFHLWNRKNILKFLKAFSEFNIDYKSKSFQLIEKKYIKSMIFVFIFLIPVFVLHLIFTINLNWQGFIFYFFRRLSDIMTVTFFGFFHLIIEMIILLLEDLKCQHSRRISSKSIDFLKNYNKICWLIRLFTETFQTTFIILVSSTTLITAAQVSTKIGICSPAQIKCISDSFTST